MVSIRQMDPSEVPDDALRARNKVDHSEYSNALEGVQIGNWYEVPLDGVGRRAVIRRLNQAASEMETPVKLRWAQQKHTKPDSAMFKVVERGSDEANEADAEGDGEDGTASDTESQPRGRRNRRAQAQAESPAEPALVGAGA